MSRQKVRIQKKGQYLKLLDDQKGKMHEIYQGQSYSGKFDATEVLDVSRNIQNERIGRFFPRKKVPYHKPPPPVYELDNRIRSV